MSGVEELFAVLNFYKFPVEYVEKYKIICPFHGDVNASLQIDTIKGRWFCFGCQRGGDAKDFIQAYENCGDLQAYIKLNKILNKKDGSFSQKKFKKIKKAESERDFEAEAKDYYFNLSKVNWKKPKKYFAKKEFEYLENRGFYPEILNNSGCKITFNENYPIIFPMFDMGKFKGYVCRTTDPVIAEKRKYLYNKGFSRRNTLVGNYKCKTVLVVEGYMDYLKARQNGVKYVCALLGWKATKEQIDKLRGAGVRTIISGLDNDKCGKQGTEFLKKYFEVIPFAYPEYIKDIGEMTEKQFLKYKKRTIENRRKIHEFIK